MNVYTTHDHLSGRAPLANMSYTIDLPPDAVPGQSLSVIVLAPDGTQTPVNFVVPAAAASGGKQQVKIGTDIQRPFVSIDGLVKFELLARMADEVDGSLTDEPEPFAIKVREHSS